MNFVLRGKTAHRPNFHGFIVDNGAKRIETTLDPSGRSLCGRVTGEIMGGREAADRGARKVCRSCFPSIAMACRAADALGLERDAVITV